MANSRICSVNGCDKPACNGRGWCGAHYSRWKRHGDPLAGKPSAAKAGEPREFINKVVATENGEGCVIWPYATTSGGYGAVKIDDKMVSAHRLVCQQVHGEPPSAEHHAAHGCRNGRKGCINPNHLRWATPTENQADRVTDGTHSRGEKCATSKLTEKQVSDIRTLYGEKSQQQIADLYGISQLHVSRIVRGKVWSWL